MNREKVVDFLIYTSIFISTITFFTNPFEGYLHYFIFFLLLPFFINRYGLPRAPFQIILLPLFIGVFQVMMGNNEWFLSLKIFLGVLLSTIFYYYVIQHYEMNIEKMFSMYLKWAYWSAIIAIIQYISFKIHFFPGYNYEWLFNKWSVVSSGEGLIRINSIYMEPSQLGIMLGPAAFVAVLNIIRKQQYEYKKYQNFIILIAIYISKSSTGYVGLFCVIMIIGLNLGYISYLLLFLLVGITAAVGLYNSVEEFKSRVDAALGLWVDQNFDIKNVNTSSFVQYNNAHIAYNNFKEHPFFGTGLGSHSVAFEKYSYTRSVVKIKGFDNNSADANSLFLRLMSETGLMGIIFIFVIITRCFVGNDGIDNKYWIISGSVLILILLYLFRQGNYFVNGFPFFVWLYYYNKKAYLEAKQTIY
ncbi:MAG TPA: O-antigen ligase family protein [Bacteroidia bacterium]|nr:O-antigen ligase family protein [Bacteroidia bacterium]